jgi:mono/diheme cytochrome c family protein
MAKDAVAIFAVLLLLFFLAWQLETPLDAPADPNDTTFVPRPDWYFLFLFQLLRYFEGNLEVIGTFVIPAISLAILFALPWIDRNPRRELRYRRFAILTLLFALGGWAWLTYAAVEQTSRRSLSRRPAGILPPRPERIKRPSEVGGLYVAKTYCFECHSMTQFGDRPNLQFLVRSKFPSGKEWLDSHLQGAGKTTALTVREAEELMSTLRLIAGDRTDLLARIPSKVRFGAHFLYNSSCLNCHRIDGQGGKTPEVPSPDLTLRLPRTKEWHIKHMHDPQSLVPNSKMPPFFHYEPHEYDAMAEYILYLHTP